MDTKVLEKFCPWARVELIDAVHLRCVRYALDDAGRAAHAADADVVNGTVLNPDEKTQRKALYEHIEELNEQRDGKGYAAFCEQQAYSWFNRFAAIRYMECHGFLSHGVRIFSNSEGKFEPDCLHMASELDLPGLDASEALDLMAAGDDEALFRRIIVAQCNELAECLPTVFDHVDDAYALTLPDNLLGRGEHDALFHLVTDIDESVWNDRKTLGWMYQFYNSELKQAFLDSKKKAMLEDIAPATQVFTPDWIVRYMVENTLGRLWMLNHPDSQLKNKMPYYIEPDGSNEDFIRISSPEEITFCDPACGSGHILDYAFDLLVEMYQESGYRPREIPELILTKNLSGLEIDERAAQFASLDLAMCGCEIDRRFLKRGVQSDIQILKSIELDNDRLPRALSNKGKLLDAIAHLSEVGSLVEPDKSDLAAIEKAIFELSDSDLFDATLRAQLVDVHKQLTSLSRSYDIVVANPPYMGSSRFNPFMSKWIKANYPDEKGDLCFAFINRICGMKRKNGEAGITATNSWMFLSSSEASRLKVLAANEISSLVQLSVHGYKGIAAQVFAFTLIDKQPDGYKGGYVRLNDFDHHSLQEPKTLEAIQNPDCGWFYRADATTFHDIPGSPIAYWASDAIFAAFRQDTPLDSIGHPRVGIQTGENARFLRLWWEPNRNTCKFDCPSVEDCVSSQATWFPYNKGGDYRKWYGNNDYVINWHNDGNLVIDNAEADGRKVMNLPQAVKFLPSVTWSKISSGNIAFRYKPFGHLFDVAGTSIFSSERSLAYLQGAANSSVILKIASLLSPTLNFEVGQIATYPILAGTSSQETSVIQAVEELRSLSKADWDAQETSWDFKRNPLI